MNKVSITGRLVADVELKVVGEKGTFLGQFTLAVDKGFGDNKKTAFVPCKVWGKSAESLSKYTKKGSKIAVCGSIEQENWEDKDGNKRSKLVIIADMYEGIEFLDSPKSEGQATNAGSFDDDVTPVDDGDIPF